MTWPEAPVIVMLFPENEIRGPSHSSYSKVVVPSKDTWISVRSSDHESAKTKKLTVVPSFRSVMSRVSPAGTVIPLRTMDEQEPFEAAAVSASVKVQPEDAVTELALAELLDALAGAAAEEEALAGAAPEEESTAPYESDVGPAL